MELFNLNVFYGEVIFYVVNQMFKVETLSMRERRVWPDLRRVSPLCISPISQILSL